MNSYLNLINTWYQSKCDGVWEHAHGFSLDNIDNPGWCIRITGEQNKKSCKFQKNIEEDSTWLSVTCTENDFTGYSGVLALEDLLSSAINWLEIIS